MNYIRTFIAALLLGSLLACTTTTVSRFQLLAKQAPSEKTVVGSGKVSGSDCVYFMNMFSLENAVKDALGNSPGATGLKDVSMEMDYYVPVRCLSVEGTPVK